VETLERVVETLRRCPDTPEVRMETLAFSLDASRSGVETLQARPEINLRARSYAG
jgi:hypothetical protein